MLPLNLLVNIACYTSTLLRFMVYGMLPYTLLLLQVAEVKRLKLKSPNIFISPIRLCVRNLPVSLTDSQLRKIFLKHAADRNAKITEVLHCGICNRITRITRSVSQSTVMFVLHCSTTAHCAEVNISSTRIS